MKNLDYLAAYLHNLTCAEAEIVPGAPYPVRFNGASTPGVFQSRLQEGEIMSVPYLLSYMERSHKSQAVQRVCRHHFGNIHALYGCGSDKRPTHRYLTIVREGRRVAYSSLTHAEQHYLDDYLALQHDSFARQRSLFFDEGKEVADSYRIRLSDTELTELAGALYACDCIECLSGTPSRIGLTRFLAHSFHIAFPSNYATICKQLTQRNSATLFLDHLRKHFLMLLFSSPKSRAK